MWPGHVLQDYSSTDWASRKDIKFCTNKSYSVFISRGSTSHNVGFPFPFKNINYFKICKESYWCWNRCMSNPDVAFECVVCKTYVLCNSRAHLGVKEFNNFHQLHFPQVTDQSQTRSTCRYRTNSFLYLYRSGLILISFSTVSCCPLQFSAVCTWSSIFKLYLVHIFNFVSACYMCICLIHIGQISSSTVSCCLLLMHQIYFMYDWIK